MKPHLFSRRREKGAEKAGHRFKFALLKRALDDLLGD